MANYHRFTYTDRLKLEALYNAGIPTKVIAAQIHKHISSIYREIKRGLYDHLTTEYLFVKRYSAYKAQSLADYNSTAKGTDLKIGNDWEYLACIESLILQGYSPAAALGHIRRSGVRFHTSICTTTLYKYIDIGLFQTVTNKNLLRRGTMRRAYHKVKTPKRPPRGESIERRPPEISTRKEFGHWEMDSVVGKKGKGQSLLVLTERKSRLDMIFKVPSQSAKYTVQILDRLERKLGQFFPQVFKSITVDNGSEFAWCAQMEQSVLTDRPRTKIYYCHPYSSWERGSNENQNAMIRRFIPKGKRLERYTHQYIRQVVHWMNNYPRRIFDFQTSQQIFDSELLKLNIPENISNFFRASC